MGRSARAEGPAYASIFDAYAPTGIALGTSDERLPSSTGTEASTRRNPSEAVVEPPSGSPEKDTGRPPLPRGWSRGETDDGTPYYANHITRSTTWTFPTASAGAGSPTSSGVGDLGGDRSMPNPTSPQFARDQALIASMGDETRGLAAFGYSSPSDGGSDGDGSDEQQQAQVRWSSSSSGGRTPSPSGHTRRHETAPWKHPTSTRTPTTIAQRRERDRNDGVQVPFSTAGDLFKARGSGYFRSTPRPISPQLTQAAGLSSVSKGMPGIADSTTGYSPLPDGRDDRDDNDERRQFLARRSFSEERTPPHSGHTVRQETVPGKGLPKTQTPPTNAKRGDTGRPRVDDIRVPDHPTGLPLKVGEGGSYARTRRGSFRPLTVGSSARSERGDPGEYRSMPNPASPHIAHGVGLIASSYEGKPGIADATAGYSLLPDGWESVVTANGNTLYVNCDTRSTTWSIPTEPQSPTADTQLSGRPRVDDVPDDSVENLLKGRQPSARPGVGDHGRVSSVGGAVAPQLAHVPTRSSSARKTGISDAAVGHPPIPDEMFRYTGERSINAPAYAEKLKRMAQLNECLGTILRPPHMEQYAELIVQSGLSMDRLPQISREYVASLGITNAIHQLKVLTAIKKHFRGKSKTSERHGSGSLLNEPANASTLEEEEEGTTDRALAEMPATRNDATARGYHEEEPRPSNVPEGAGLSASRASDRSLPDLPDEADGDFTLVGKFGSYPATYPASTAADDYLQIHVDPGCLRQGQAAGPITIKRDRRYLVECEGCSFLVSAVVDCQPSGSKFDVPLIFDFRVRETALKRDEVRDDKSTDGETGGDLDDEQRTQYMEELKAAYKVLQREEEGEPWNSLREEQTAVVYERGVFLLRAKIDHFSQGCLAKRIPLESAGYDEVARFGWRPHKKEVEFVNATDRPLIFLVLPTSWSHSTTTSVDFSLACKVELKRAVSKAATASILHEATDPQLLQVPCSGRAVAALRAGQACPFAVCTLAEKTGAEARVALVTDDRNTVAVWAYRVVKHRTRMVVLPRQFADGMLPLIGTHNRDEQGTGGQSVMNIALMIIANSMSASEHRGPVSTV